MATYKEIHGIKVQYRDSDATAIEGDVWYNSSTGLLKMYASLGAWSSGGNTNTGIDAGGHCGIQTAAMYFGGRGGHPITTGVDTSETYDGSSWSETADLNTAVYQNGGFGTTTAGASFGRLTLTADTEEFNGTSWTEVNDLNNAKRAVHGTGTQTAGITAGGTPNPSGARPQTALYDGTNWTEVADLNNPKQHIPLAGTTTAAIALGGMNPNSTGSTTVETWNGTSWSNDPAAMNEGRIQHAGSGTQTAAIIFGGYGGGGSTNPTANTESFDGSSWTEVANLATARDAIMGAQSSPNTTSLALGGQLPASSAVSNSTEEWNFAAAVETVAFD